MKRCVKCNAEATPLASYCSNCGAELEVTWKYECLACGHNSDYPSNFCTRCGSPLFVPTGVELGREGVEQK